MKPFEGRFKALVGNGMQMSWNQIYEFDAQYAQEKLERRIKHD